MMCDDCIYGIDSVCTYGKPSISDSWDCLSKIDNETYSKIYNKAIDDFLKFASDMPTVEEEDGTIRPMWLEEMAEQLKAGETE